MAGFEPGDVPIEVGDVVVIDEVGTEAATPEAEFGCRFVEDALAAAAEDARVVRAQVRGVEHPRALFVDLVEADPLVDVGWQIGAERCRTLRSLRVEPTVPTSDPDEWSDGATYRVARDRARWSCTDRIALEPSPTAAATRFIEP